LRKKQNTGFKKALLSVTGLIILFLILVLVNIMASYANVRWDATEDKSYSLSQGTRSVLSSMTQPVIVRFFYSQSNPDIPGNIKLYARRVKDFLTEYVRESNGLIKLEMIDPRPDSDEEEWAQKYGLQPVQAPGGEPITCGLVFTASDQEETIAWLDPSKEQLLEYDFTTIIQGLQNPEKKTVGIITSLPVFGSGARAPGPGQPPSPEWVFVTEMKKIYDVQEIKPTVRLIEPSLDLLMVVFPKDMNSQLEYAIDQYVLSGGNALIFVDPLCVSYRSGRQQDFMRSSGSALDQVFKAWGVRMDSAKAIADYGQPTQVRTSNTTSEENPLMISARGEAFNRENVITVGLESMLFPVAGAIVRVDEKDKAAPIQDYTFETLVDSSEDAAVVDAFKAFLGADAVKKDFVPAKKRFNVIVRVRGTFKTAFPDGPPKPENSDTPPVDETKYPQLKDGKKPATLVIVSDADMLADNFYVQRRNFFGMAVSEMYNDNLNFLSNSSEILTGSDELIGLRSRGKIERPFTVVLNLKKRAKAQWLDKEKELVQQIEETNRKLKQLESEKDASQKEIISPQQEAEVIKFREQKQQISRELKQVRKNLRADIETLGATLKGLNIFLMPLLVSIVGFCFAVYRQRKLRRR
jgi:gliding motility-associatede transport system auxiliary component